MTRIVVCDTGPLLHLGEANALHLLQLAGEILIPEVVAREFQENAAGQILPDWVQILELEEVHERKAIEWNRYIDQGEAAALALSVQVHADWLLTDDTKARQFAGQILELEVHGSIGFLLWAVAAGHIADQKTALELLGSLANSSLWVSERVLQNARAAIEKLFSA